MRGRQTTLDAASLHTSGRLTAMSLMPPLSVITSARNMMHTTGSSCDRHNHVITQWQPLQKRPRTHTQHSHGQQCTARGLLTCSKRSNLCWELPAQDAGYQSHHSTHRQLPRSQPASLTQQQQPIRGLIQAASPWGTPSQLTAPCPECAACDAPTRQRSHQDRIARSCGPWPPPPWLRPPPCCCARGASAAPGAAGRAGPT